MSNSITAPGFVSKFSTCEVQKYFDKIPAKMQPKQNIFAGHFLRTIYGSKIGRLDEFNWFQKVSNGSDQSVMTL